MATNAIYTGLHADAAVQLPAAREVTTHQYFWFVEGDLEALLRRVSRDLQLQTPSAGNGLFGP